MIEILKFQAFVLRAAMPILEEMTEQDNEALTEAVNNHLFDGEGPIRVEKAEYSKMEQLITILSTGCQEIAETWEIIQDTVILVRRFPFSSTRIDKTRYLKFLISSHWNEIYILRERMIAYPVRIKRFYKGTGHEEHLGLTLGRIPPAVKDGYDRITKRRGKHVHDFRHDDRDLQKLELMQSFSEVGPELSDDWRALQNHSYKEKRLKITKEFESNIYAVGETLDMYFKFLYEAISTEGELRTPESEE